MSQKSKTVIIIGGAIMGSFTAYFLRKNGFEGAIKVVEKDGSYQFSSTALSAASIRTQFSCPFNIGMSLFAADLIKNIKQHFGEDADVGFREYGYLMLGSPEATETQRANALMQRGQGASIEILTPAEAAARHPWLNVEDIGIATYGSANEGWFDAWALLQLVRREARKLGVEYVNGEVVAIERGGDAVTGVRLGDGSRLPCDWCVNTAGPAGGEVA